MGIKINYLTKDELLYELSFHGIKVNLNTCLKLLRAILRQKFEEVGDVGQTFKQKDKRKKLRKLNKCI